MFNLVLYNQILVHILKIFLRQKTTLDFLWTDVNSKYESFYKEPFLFPLFLFIPVWISNIFVPLWHDNMHPAYSEYIHFKKKIL